MHQIRGRPLRSFQHSIQVWLTPLSETLPIWQVILYIMDHKQTLQVSLHRLAKGRGGYLIRILVVGRIRETSGLRHHRG